LAWVSVAWRNGGFRSKVAEHLGLPGVAWRNGGVMRGIMGRGLPGLAFRSKVAEHLALPCLA